MLISFKLYRNYNNNWKIRKINTKLRINTKSPLDMLNQRVLMFLRFVMRNFLMFHQAVQSWSKNPITQKSKNNKTILKLNQLQGSTLPTNNLLSKNSKKWKSIQISILNSFGMKKTCVTFCKKCSTWLKIMIVFW